MLSTRDPNRACKHIRSALEQIYPGFFVRQIEVQCGEQHVLVMRDICKDWVDVHAGKRGGARVEKLAIRHHFPACMNPA